MRALILRIVKELFWRVLRDNPPLIHKIAWFTTCGAMPKHNAFSMV